MAAPIDRTDVWIKTHEAFRSKAYDDATGKALTVGNMIAGNITAGYGRNLMGRGLTVVEADYLFQNDKADAISHLADVFGQAVNNWAPARRTALIDMMFNMGPATFGEFHHMILAIKSGDWVAAARYAGESKWFVQVGARAADDVSMILNGVYTE